MVVKSGMRDAVTAILRRDVDELKKVGCQAYIITLDTENPDTIWVMEVWDSADGHQASLQLPSVAGN